MATELERARNDYRDATRGDFPEAERVAARAYIAQLEQKVAELEAQIRNRGRRGHW